MGYPTESDKLKLRSGTVLQREVTERERRRLERERKREKELISKSSKVTSSSDAMDTDEAGKHTQNILARFRFRHYRSRKSESAREEIFRQSYG